MNGTSVTREKDENNSVLRLDLERLSGGGRAVAITTGDRQNQAAAQGTPARRTGPPEHRHRTDPNRATTYVI